MPTLNSDELYRIFSISESHQIHTDPEVIFQALKMDDIAVAMWITEVLKGPGDEFEERLEKAMGELQDRYVHYCVDVELGVD